MPRTEAWKRAVRLGFAQSFQMRCRALGPCPTWALTGSQGPHTRLGCEPLHGMMQEIVVRFRVCRLPWLVELGWQEGPSAQDAFEARLCSFSASERVWFHLGLV